MECGALCVAHGHKVTVGQFQSNANAGKSPEWCCRLEQVTSYRIPIEKLVQM
jgi:hypothetical protein